MRITTALALALALSACKIYGGLTEDDITAVKAEIAEEVKSDGLILIEIKLEREVDDTRATGYVITGRKAVKSLSQCEVLLHSNGHREWSCVANRGYVVP